MSTWNDRRTPHGVYSDTSTGQPASFGPQQARPAAGLPAAVVRRSEADRWKRNAASEHNGPAATTASKKLKPPTMAKAKLPSLKPLK